VVAYCDLVEAVAEDVMEVVHSGLSALIREVDSARPVLERLEFGDRARFVRAASFSALAAFYDGRNLAGLALARRAVAAATGMSADTALANYSLVLLAQETGHINEAAEAAAVALDLYEREGDLHRTAQALAVNSMVDVARGNMELARSHIEQAVSLEEELGTPFIGQRLNMLACFEVVAGEFAQGEGHARRAVASFRKAGQSQGQGAASDTVAVALAGQGRFGEALDWSQKALQMHLQEGQRRGADLLRTAVVIALGLGRKQRARTLAAAAEALGEELGTPRTRFPILAAGIGRALALTGPEAERAFERGRRMSWREAVRFAAGEENEEEEDLPRAGRSSS
jgi:tetratricopeptide (TPR) repeat protein